ncbi:MAG TPA: DegT/DnrJ/EryC1/StrS family aminotransferase [Candidatus Woesebacteria bacterium]|nr:DegT/DnrJ/EryC1/StrS family aminotransferase [Candidatus Woesebacteria bacterium]
MIFNSLGASYDWVDCWLAIKELIWPNQQSKPKLQKLLSQQFDGKARLLFNGRDALEYCLTAYGIGEGDEVLTQGLSCASLEEAIQRVQARAVYMDLDQQYLGVTKLQLQRAWCRAKKPKAVIVQHGWGYPDQLTEIAFFCCQHKLILIEDLAQSVGALTRDKKAVGTAGDALIFSFGRDKIWDGISGGAVVFCNHSQFKPQLPDIPDWFAQPNDWSQKKIVLKLLFYPLMTAGVRLGYQLGIGQALHFLLQKINWMQSALISPHAHFQSFPAYFAPLILRRWEGLADQIEARRVLAQFYHQQLQTVPRIKVLTNEKYLNQAVHLRFPILLDSSADLLSLLDHFKRHHIYLADRWYKAVVDSGRQPFASSYRSGECPVAERWAERVLNLPTHRLISQKKAAVIVRAIKTWSQK